MCVYQKGNKNIPTRGNRFLQEKVKLCIPKRKNLFPLSGNKGGSYGTKVNWKRKHGQMNIYILKKKEKKKKKRKRKVIYRIKNV